MAEKIIIAELGLDTQAFINAATLTTKKINELIVANKKLVESGKKNSQEFVKNTVELKKNRAQLLQQQKAIIALDSPYTKLSNQLIRARAKAKDLAAEFGVNSRQARNAATEVNKLDRQLKKIDKSLGQSQRNVGNYGSSIARLALRFIGLTTVIFGAIRVLRRSIGIFTTFEKKNAELAAILQVETSQMSELEAESKRLGATTAKTSTEIVDLQISFARLGFSMSEIIDLTEATINGSIAMNSELDKTASLAGAVVNTFDDFSSIDAPEIIDILALSTAKSALNFEKLEKGIPIVAGAANAAGVPFTTLISLMGKLSDAGIDVSTSSTAIRNIFIESAAQGLNFSEIIELIKNSQDKLTAANDEFGKRAAVSAAVLAQNIDATKELDTQLKNATGTAQEMARKGLDTLSGSGTLFLSAWQGLILGLENGQGGFAKTLRSIIDFGTGLLNSLTPQRNLIKELENERLELITLESKIKDINTSQEDRLELIEDLQEKYPDFLKNIDAETISNQDLSKSIKAVNDQLINKIILQTKDDEITEQNNRIAQKKLDLFNQEDTVRNGLIKLVEKHNLTIKDGVDLEGQVADAIRQRREQQQTTGGRLIDSATELDFQLNVLQKTQKSVLALDKESNKLTEEREKLIKRLGITIKEKAVVEKEAGEGTKLISEKEKEERKKEIESFQKNIDDIKKIQRESEQDDLEKQQLFEDQKRSLQNEIDLLNAETQEEKAVLKAEQDLEKQELALEKLELNILEQQELEKLLKEAHLLEIDGIETKFRNKKESDQIKSDKAELSRKKKLNATILNESINLVGQETRLGQALIAIKGILAVKETLIQLGLFKSKIALNIGEATADSAKGLAKTASAAPFPANIPLIIGFIAQVSGVIAAIKGAAGQAKNVSVPRFYEGGVIGGDANIPVSMRNQGGDDVLIQAKRGEVILNQEQQSRAGGAAFFKSIGVPSFANGGQVLTSQRAAISQAQTINFEEFGDIISEKINAIKIVAIESEITEAQFSQVEIEQGAVV